MPPSGQTGHSGFTMRLKSRLADFTPSYFPVAWKMGIAISLLVVVGMTLLGSVLISRQVDQMQQQANVYGHAIASQLADSAREPLLAEDNFTLKILVGNLTGGNGLKGAAVFNKQGTLLQQSGRIPARLSPADHQQQQWKAAGTPYTTYTAPIQIKHMTAGFVAVTLSRHAIIAAQQEVKNTILNATLLMSLLVIIAVFLVCRWLARPIHDLVAATRALSQGDLHFRMHERRNDEIGQLIDAYNEMASGLLKKDQVELTLSRFVSPSVARKMMQDIDQVQLGGHETPATILFADIVGFTSLSEGLTPDEVAHLLNDYFRLISCAASFYRGTIDKYVGDCAMLVFGAPEKDQEHFYHGLCCSLMIQSLVQRINLQRESEGKLTVQFRIGINSGKVLAGNLGSNERMQYTVVGDTVNLASRLSDLAVPGEIILPSELLDDANITSRFSFDAAQEIRVRGKADPVATARLNGMHDELENLMNQRIIEFMDQLTPSPLPKTV